MEKPRAARAEGAAEGVLLLEEEEEQAAGGVEERAAAGKNCRSVREV